MNQFDPRHVYSLYTVEAPDGRYYVGCTARSVEARWRGHHDNPPRSFPGPEHAIIADYLKLHGKEAFTVTHVASALGPEDACAVETALIAQYGAAYPHGMNRAPKSNLKRRPGVPRSYVARDIISVRRRRFAWPPTATAGAA